MTREEIIARNPIITVAQEYGMSFKRMGGELYSVCCFHPDKKPSFRVNIDKGTWYCDPCGKGGSVIDFVMLKENLTVEKAMQKLGGTDSGNGHSNGSSITELCHYDYTDENGKMLYQVIRYVPKTFRQRHKSDGGDWIWNMDGVRRVLYRLPEVIKTQDLFIVEGEKDVDNLVALGFPATCNVGGAKKWLDSYSETLKGKNVFIVPDNDEPGREHAEMVAKSLAGKAQIFRIDLTHKDISEFIKESGGAAQKAVLGLIDKAKPILPGANVPIKSMLELESEYRKFIATSESRSLSFSRWIPTLGLEVRNLVPGELMVILADTGVGKTAILQNIARNARPLSTLMFELELPGSLIFERFVQMQEKITGDKVHSLYKQGEPPPWNQLGEMSHIFTCTESKLGIVDIERITNEAELKMGERPALVMIDYIGLINSVGNSRYERMSDVAEQAKVLAKSTNTIVIIASQVRRASGNDDCSVALHDAKDSGSIENSAGLVIGAWREGDGEILKLKILKNTKGRSGRVIACDFNGATMRITEPSRIDDADIPRTNRF